NSGAARNYGFPVDPLKFEGGGCTSFAAAAFQNTLLDIPLFAASKREMLMPRKLMGVMAKPVAGTVPPELAPDPRHQHKVPGLPLLFGKASWASPGEPNQKFW